MSGYQILPTDPEELITAMTAEYEALSGVSVHPASPEKLLIQWAAAVLVQERALANYAADQNIPSRAEGENLDALAELFYTRERPRAKAAVCVVRFSCSEAREEAILIPAGTRVTDRSRTLVWETERDAYIQPGETDADVSVRCQTAGAAGNGYAPGQLNTLVDLYAYYSGCVNLTESDGGSDAATDAEFRELLRESMDGYSCAGSLGGYAYFAKQVSTEIADVVPNSPSPGEVVLYVLMKDGTPAGEEMKRAVLEACSGETVRAFTDFVRVEDPESVAYDIDLTYYTEEGADGAAAAEQVEAAVTAFAAWQSGKLGRDINPSVLIGKLMQTGIKRVDLRAPVFTRLRDGRMTLGTAAADASETVPQIAALRSMTVRNGGDEDE